MNSLSVSIQRKQSSVASGRGYFQFGCPLFLCILFTIPMVSLGQLKEEKKRIGSKIVDDTTKNVYGPKTTLWTTEKNLFYNKKTYYAVDTSINDYHRWTHVQRVNNFYTDLGNVGTAMNPIFFTFSSSIGVTAGFNVYNQFYESAEPKYFDTKSPYTRMFIIWGGQGRSMTKVEFSRNINPRWNFGFNFRPILADRQLLRQKGVRQTTSYYYDLYTTFRTPNEKYFLLANYRRLRHRVAESGGVAQQQGEPYINLFAVEASQTLASAKSEDLRNGIHLFHQYKVGNALQLYHIADKGKQSNKFFDVTSTEPKDFYDSIAVKSDSVSDNTSLSVFQNELGIKGNAAFLFYSFYYKQRSYDYRNQRLNEVDLTISPKSTEYYVGGRIAFQIDSVTELSGSAEYLLDRNYKIDADLKTPWLDASLKSYLSRPGLMQNAYSGGYDFWNNSFSDVLANSLSGFLKVKLGPLFVSPGATFSTFSNYIFFRESPPVSPSTQRVLPFQSKGNQTIFSPELRLTLNFLKHFYLRPHAIYTSFIRNDDDAFRIPQLFINTQLAYEGMIFKGNLQVQIGIDAHWKSAYEALGYDPAIQQFYNQNSTIAPSFLLADVFLNGKMKRGRFFIKYHNLVQAFTQSGYLTATPNYTGQRNIMDFGFELLLFD